VLFRSKPERVFASGRSAPWAQKLLLFGAALAALARPLPLDAEIRWSVAHYDNPAANPAPSAATIERLQLAVNLLAANPALERHPIRQYLNNPSLLAQLIFDLPQLEFDDTTAAAEENRIYLTTERELRNYVEILTHEFIHVAKNEKYGHFLDYGFLFPETYAFIYSFEEAIAKTCGLWAYAAEPALAGGRNRQILGWWGINNSMDSYDALENELRAVHPEWSAAQTNAATACTYLDDFLTVCNTYHLTSIPEAMACVYGQRNTFLLPAYFKYTEHSEELARHMWNYLTAMLPFELEDWQTFDHYRAQFKNKVQGWARYSSTPESSIAYWINYPRVTQAYERLNRQYGYDHSKYVYDYLTLEDERKLNQVMREINFNFPPINTAGALRNSNSR
jgi:hypothetical protein